MGSGVMGISVAANRGSATNLKMLVFRPAAHEVNGLMFSTGLALGGSGCACHDGEAAAEVSDESPALGQVANWAERPGGYKLMSTQVSGRNLHRIKIPTASQP